MSRKAICILALAAALGATAETTISHVVVNQRWPWSEKVDVDFVLSGETNDVEVTATWDAHPEPYRLGTLFAVAPGRGRLTWDPSKSPFAGQTLTGFTVAVSNAAASAHAYLVVDLVNGGYEFLPEVPAGGWTDAHKSSKMVFRRIPAGTYTLGEERTVLEHLNAVSLASYCYPRNVTFTSDFYVGIYKYTEAQHACLETRTAGTTYTPHNVSYEILRGANPAVDWPNTGYMVATNSVVAKLREKAGAGLVVDLCEEEQWEVAARAGTTTIWPNGGTASDDLATLAGYLNVLAAWSGTNVADDTPVGTREANGWGLYDVAGLGGEWTLDKARNKGTVPHYGLSDSVDPVGANDAVYTYRGLRNANGKYTPSDEIWQLLPCRRQMAAPSSSSYSTRFCIHLKPLGSLSFEGP